MRTKYYGKSEFERVQQIREAYDEFFARCIAKGWISHEWLWPLSSPVVDVQVYNNFRSFSATVEILV